MPNGLLTTKLVVRLLRFIPIIFASILVPNAVVLCQPLIQDSAPARTPTAKYDPSRDALKDVLAAVAEAKRTNRRVLIEVGGEWCVWCHIMDRFFDEHQDLMKLRDTNFVTVKVNFSPENKNQALLSKFPTITGYPHLFVVDEDGHLVVSQPTDALEAGRSYDKNRFKYFLEKAQTVNPKQKGK
jgi:thiol:disulfide interchange protein